ncbi:GAF domain-containing protein [Chloroflexota bacterium]
MTNEPQQLLEMALDTLLEKLKVDCCWIQLIDMENQRLSLVAHRGFTPDMKLQIVSSNLESSLGMRVAGLGQKIIIPDLNKDGVYGLSAFQQAGYVSLLTVPIETYRIHGIIGVASSNKQHFDKEFAELLSVIGGLVGMALNKALLYLKSRDEVPSGSTSSVPDNSPERPVEVRDQTRESAEVTTVESIREYTPDYESVEIKPDVISHDKFSERPITVIDQTRESAEVLAEFARMWHSITPGEVFSKKTVSERKGVVEPIKVYSNIEVSQIEKTNEATLLPVHDEVKPEKPPELIVGLSDAFAQHCRKMKIFRTSHANATYLAESSTARLDLELVS